MAYAPVYRGDRVKIVDMALVYRNFLSHDEAMPIDLWRAPRQSKSITRIKERGWKSMSETRRWNAARASEIIGEHLDLEGPMMPILHALQEEFGYIDKEAAPLIAKALNLTRAEVHGVITFYHDFRHAPAGRHVLKLCRGESCQSMGSEELARKFLDGLGLEWGGSTADGNLTVEAVYCLGLCACSPAAMLDDEPIGALDGERLAETVELVRS